MKTEPPTPSLRNRLARRKHLRFFPIWGASKGYRTPALAEDLRAGMNVALLAFPQGMAYAAIAGLPIEFGLYGAIIASLVAPIFTGSRFIAAGPTNATAVLVFGALLGLNFADATERAAVIPLVALLTGVFLVVGAFLKVAALVQYVSRSVIAGYITAAALYIIINQLKMVLGFDFDVPPGGTVLHVALGTIENLPQSHLPTVFLSLAAGIFYWGLQRKVPGWPLVGVTLVVFSTVAAIGQSWLQLPGWDGIRTLSAVNPADWHIAFPRISQDRIAVVANLALVLAFICMLEGCSIGKTLAARSGEKINLNQEIYGLGMANVACSILQGMPASGSLTRSQLNVTSGARTPWATIFCGLFCAFGVFLLGKYIAFIPVSVLGVLVISIGLSLINRHVLRVVWTSTRSDRIVLVTTFSAALIASLDFAIMLGAGVSILLFLRKAAQPELIEYTRDEDGGFMPLPEGHKETVPEVSIVHVEGDLFFGAAELFRDQMRRACAKPNLKVVILKLRNAHHLDATSVLALEDLIRFMHSEGRALLISEARTDAIEIFKNSGLLKLLGEDNLFPDDLTNPTLSTSRAIRRAMSYLEGRDAEVKIFVGSSKKQDPDAPEDNEAE